MPTDYGDNDSPDMYVETCSCIESLLATSDVNQYCIVGDMNCSTDNRFFLVLNQLTMDNFPTFIDLRLLSNMVT